jgi:hypothetical protein
MALSHEEFDALMDEAVIAFKTKQEHLTKTHGFGDAAMAAFTERTQTLHLLDAADRPFLEADAIEIGTYNTQAKGWLWAWANKDIAAHGRARSEKLKGLADVTGFEIFESARAVRLPDEAMAWRLAAMSVRHLEALGAYRLPSPDGVFMGFVAVMSVRDLRAGGGFGTVWRA